MNKLAANINIFENNDIMRFIKIESNFIKHLRDAWHSENASIGISHSKSSNKDQNEKNHQPFLSIMGDVSNKLGLKPKQRGLY